MIINHFFLVQSKLVARFISTIPVRNGANSIGAITNYYGSYESYYVLIMG